MTLDDRVCFLPLAPGGGGEPLLCPASMRVPGKCRHTHLRDCGLRERNSALLLVGPEPRLPAVPPRPGTEHSSAPGVLGETKNAQSKEERAPGALLAWDAWALSPWRPPLGNAAFRPVVEHPFTCDLSHQMWMNVPQALAQCAHGCLQHARLLQVCAMRARAGC